MNQVAKQVSPLSLRTYEPEKDYDICIEWFTGRDGSGIRKEWLPPTGVVVEHEGEPVTMSWVYITDSEVAQIAWTVTKPEISPFLAYDAVATAIMALVRWASECNVSYIQCMPDKSGLSKVMQRIGFEKSTGYDYLHLYNRRG